MAKLILKSTTAAVAHVIEGIRENKSQNGAPISSWSSAKDAVGTYIDGETADLAKGVSLQDVVSGVATRLSAEMAFEEALTSGPAFVAWAEGRNITRDELNRVLVETTHNDVAESAGDVDYIAALENGDFLMWGAEHVDGRDLIVGVQGKEAASNLAVIFVPKWTSED